MFTLTIAIVLLVLLGGLAALESRWMLGMIGERVSQRVGWLPSLPALWRPCAPIGCPYYRY
jgi:hypothetical protein